MKRADLEAIWAGLEAPAAKGDLVGQPAPANGVGVGAMVALDGDRRRHLLLPAPANAQDLSQPPIRGIGVSIDDLRIDDRPVKRYFDVSCREMAMHENFTAIAVEILETLSGDEERIGQTLDSIFDRWRWFWRVAPSSMSSEAIIGLFGELWFIEYWLPPVDKAVLSAWTGPAGDRHDFKWSQASVEVKATRVSTDGSARHRISRLDQLEDPEQGALYLFSLQVAVDAIGGHSLNQSVSRLRASLAKAPQLLASFEQRIGMLGYNPAHAQHYDVPLRVVAEELYRVEEGFPRLTRRTLASLPAGVDDVSYTLGLAACRDWLVATKPGAESQALRSSLTS
jgi:Putative  PD-(D/E)XK family member, (DUF4420)